MGAGVMSHGLVRRHAELLALVLLVGSAHAEDIYVDDDAPFDPGHRDPNHSDPLEDGSPEHPFDAIQEALDVAESGDTIVILGGAYAGPGWWGYRRGVVRGVGEPLASLGSLGLLDVGGC